MIEAPQATAETIAKPRKGRLFTPEIAAEMAKRSQQARKANRERERADIERAKAAMTLAQPLLADSVRIAAEAISAPSKTEHARASVEALQKQMEAIDSQLLKACDPDSWQKLSTARQRLFVQWQVLVGLAGPGNRRPGRERTTRETRSASPLDLSSSNPTE